MQPFSPGDCAVIFAAAFSRRIARNMPRPCLDAATGGRDAHPTRNRAIPDSLVAVVRTAMALEPAQRYPTVADLQRDLTAYQSGFATSAEKAGAWKQFALFVKRNRAASIGVTAVLLIGGVLGTKAVIEGRRAERALTELKASAPALLQLAESEAGFQRFDSALGKLDAALALDPAHLPARWQRAWVLLALERWSEAADALRLARQHDPDGAGLGGHRAVDASALGTDGAVPSILPAVEKLAAAPAAGRWKSDAAREVFAHLQSVEATGPALAFSAKLKLGAEERRKLADRRLLAALGKGNYNLIIENDGLVALNVSAKPLRSLDAIRGLPIDRLNAQGSLITDLQPLRGMLLQYLFIDSNKSLTDLSPLRGMPLQVLSIRQTSSRSLSPLAGMRLSRLDAAMTQIGDLTPLAGLPLTDLDLTSTPVARIDALRGMPLVKLNLSSTAVVDCSPLKGTPLETLLLGSTSVSDLSFMEGTPMRTLDLNRAPISNIAALRGLPLEVLILRSTPIPDLTPLQGAPLKDLDLRDCKKLTDYTPVLTLPRLERLKCDVLPAALLPLRESATLQNIEADAYPGEGDQGARPVAEFWRAYDAHQAAGRK